MGLKEGYRGCFRMHAEVNPRIARRSVKTSKRDYIIEGEQ